MFNIIINRHEVAIWNLIVYLQEEHMEIRDNRKDGSSLTWSEVMNMPYTTKVRSIFDFFLLLIILSTKKNPLTEIFFALLCSGNQWNTSQSHNLTLVFKKSCTGFWNWWYKSANSHLAAASLWAFVLYPIFLNTKLDLPLYLSFDFAPSMLEYLNGLRSQTIMWK